MAARPLHSPLVRSIPSHPATTFSGHRRPTERVAAAQRVRRSPNSLSKAPVRRCGSPLRSRASRSASFFGPVIAAAWRDDGTDDPFAQWEVADARGAGRRGSSRRGKHGERTGEARTMGNVGNAGDSGNAGSAELGETQPGSRRGKGSKLNNGVEGLRSRGEKGELVAGEGGRRGSDVDRAGEQQGHSRGAGGDVLALGAVGSPFDTADDSRAAFRADGAAAPVWRVVGDGASSTAPPSSASFVKPLSTLYPRLPCRVCHDTKLVECACCDGIGTLARGGFQKRNPISIPRIIGSKWTAMERTFGWRHFRVDGKRRMGSTAGFRGTGKGGAEAPVERDVDGNGAALIVLPDPEGASSPGTRPGGDWFVQMVATCDPNTRFWVKAHNLKDRDHWAMGWLQKEELLAMGSSLANAEFAGVGTGANDGLTKRLVCKACQGQGKISCPRCKEVAEMREKERERRKNAGIADGFNDYMEDDGVLEIIEV